MVGNDRVDIAGRKGQVVVEGQDIVAVELAGFPDAFVDGAGVPPVAVAVDDGCGGQFRGQHFEGSVGGAVYDDDGDGSDRMGARALLLQASEDRPQAGCPVEGGDNGAYF